MNTPSSVKTKNHLDHTIYMSPPAFFLVFFFFVCFFPKSAQVGLRLPDCTHIYSNMGFSYSTYNLYQGKKQGLEKVRRREKYTNLPHPPPPRKKEIPQQGYLCAKHNGRVCSPNRWFCRGSCSAGFP